MAQKDEITFGRIVRENTIEFELECAVPPDPQAFKAKIAGWAIQYKAKSWRADESNGRWRVLLDWPKEQLQDSIDFTEYFRARSRQQQSKCHCGTCPDCVARRVATRASNKAKDKVLADQQLTIPVEHGGK